MVFSNILIAFTAVVSSLVATRASPVGSIGQQADALVARQDIDWAFCRYVVRAGDLLDVNLPKEFGRVLTQLYTESSPGVGVEYDKRLEIAMNGDGTWSWSWLLRLFDSTTHEFLTPEAVQNATEKLVGLGTEAGNATWTIESAGCDPFFAPAESTDSGVTRVFTQDQSKTQKSRNLAEEENWNITATCTLGMRPDLGSDTILIGVDLRQELTESWVSSLDETIDGRFSVAYTSYVPALSRNSDGTWTMILPRILLWGVDFELLPIPETIAINHGLVGVHVSPSLGSFFVSGWLIESVTCIEVNEEQD